MDVSEWVGQGGSALGTNRTTPKNQLAEVAAKFKQHNIHGLLIVGGFEVRRKDRVIAGYSPHFLHCKTGLNHSPTPTSV